MQIYTTMSSNVKVVEFERLSRALLSEKHLLPQSPEDLIAQFKAGLSILGIQDSHIVAHATLWELCTGWYEMGTVFVARDLRGAGIGETLYKATFAAHTEKNIILTTTNPAALRVGVKIGVVPVYRRDLPMSVWHASCVCQPEKTGGSREDCAMAYGEQSCSSPCIFRVSAETAKRNNLTGVPLPRT